MVTQAFGFDGLAPNVIVKFPTTRAGVAAMEEASYRGISVNGRQSPCGSMGHVLADPPTGGNVCASNGRGAWLVYPPQD